MSIIAEVVEGETARITLPLTEDGAALNGTGFTVTDLLLTTCNGEAIDTSGDFNWVSAAAGTVYYDADEADFKARLSPYRVRVKLTDSDGKIRFYPNCELAEIKVWSPR